MQIQIDKQPRNKTQEQDKLSDIEQQQPFGDGATKSTGTSYNEAVYPTSPKIIPHQGC